MRAQYQETQCKQIISIKKAQLARKIQSIEHLSLNVFTHIFTHVQK